MTMFATVSSHAAPPIWIFPLFRQPASSSFASFSVDGRAPLLVGGHDVAGLRGSGVARPVDRALLQHAQECLLLDGHHPGQVPGGARLRVGLVVQPLLGHGHEDADEGRCLRLPACDAELEIVHGVPPSQVASPTLVRMKSESQRLCRTSRERGLTAFRGLWYRPAELKSNFTFIFNLDACRRRGVTIRVKARGRKSRRRAASPWWLTGTMMACGAIGGRAQAADAPAHLVTSSDAAAADRGQQPVLRVRHSRPVRSTPRWPPSARPPAGRWRRPRK